MCTLVVAARTVPGYALVVVANRDEAKDRASSPPLRWPGGFVAPRDDVAGGTWLGLNDAGVFVAITNRFSGPRDPTRSSRGAIVVDALAGGSARAIHERLRVLSPSAYNGFHLLYADRTDVLVTVSDGHELAQLSLGKGLFIVTERSFGGAGRAPGAADSKQREGRIAAAWARMPIPLRPSNATRLLAEHDPSAPFDATCIHLDELGYGTRSALVLGVADGRRPDAETEMLWADGPPCTTLFRAVDLAGRAPPASSVTPAVPVPDKTG